ncbi:MAG: acetolactate synthase small subunit [Phycisphaerales bacterium]|nr:acetolactate synthase small subunit [Phycisphaerales bacterium]
MNETISSRHVIAALVTNEPGVLAQVAGMFAARGFNIDSLVVGRTENPELSRMTIVVTGSDAIMEQVRKQLGKLTPVVKVVDYKEVPYVERDLMLVQVSTAGTDGPGRRSEIIELVNLFRGRIVDVSPDKLMIELSGTEDKMEAFIDLMAPFGIVELARTGVIAMPRGSSVGDVQAVAMPARPKGSRNSGTQNAGPGIDPSQLPPG